IAPPLGWHTGLLALAAGLLPLLPLLLFNVQTGGTWAALGGNLERSYYGVDNSALVQNLVIRIGQLGQTLAGDHLWYLGGLYGNRWSVWLALMVGAIGLWCNWRKVVPPLLLLSCAVAASVVTISHLFVTHYALIQPFAVGTVAVGLGVIADTL